MKQGMISLGFLSYDEMVGREGEVYLDAEFFNFYQLTQLKMLKDWIDLLESIRESINGSKFGEH